MVKDDGRKALAERARNARAAMANERAVTVNVPGERTIAVTLNFETRRWSEHAPGEPLAESQFPLTAILDGRRYELYSDETFAEAEL